MLFPLDVGTSFCFVNTRPIETMRSTQKWKSGLRTCAHRHNNLCETHSHFVSVSPVYWSKLQVCFTTNLNTCMLSCARKQLLTRDNEWVPPNETALQQGKWLTSHLSVLLYLDLSLSFSNYSNCSLFTFTSPLLHLFIHALTLLSLFHTFSTTFFPPSLSATHHLFALLSHSTPCHLPRPSLSLFFFRGDVYWQMIWQRKTSGEKKLT